MTDIVATKTKKPKPPPFEICGAFIVRVVDNNAKKSLHNLVRFHTSHVRNMVLILRNNLYDAQKLDSALTPVYNAFIKPDILRDTVYGRAGKKKAEQIALIRDHFADNPMFQALCEHCQAELDAKTFYSVLKAVQASYNQFFTNIKDYLANPAAYLSKMGNSGIPRPPKPKKINYINNAGLLLDGEKWSFKTETKTRGGLTVKHHCLSLKVGADERISIPVNPTKFPVPDGQTLRSLNINISNDAVYLNFTYGRIRSEHVDLDTQPAKPSQQDNKIPIYAGGDVGLQRLLALFINDELSPSVLVCSKKYKNYNVQFNKHKSKLDEAIGQCVLTYKTVERDFVDYDGVRVQDTIKVPASYDSKGIELRRLRTHMIECRNRFFDAEFDKISRRVVDYLLQAGVTELTLSRNLSFLKTQDEKTQQCKLRRKTKQQFYHLPFGRLLNHIARKCQLVGIKINDIDEAYSSKYSCFSANVNEAKSLRKTRNSSLTATDGKGRRVKRGLFRDDVINFTYHADINGAVNHIKLANSEYTPTHLLHKKHKFCNPVLVTSDREFIRLTRRVSEAVGSQDHPG